ncbi:oxalate:formate antiporter [Massilia sp. KIM]|uniref:nucleotidyltransferase domain-containing protein n=1 Tax=Massilia sp. KIM TaxID=1955422 RepID=UPI00098F323B|nr:nucleotidyltransferase domain-containing protein [Massilia sp. KIM]OON64231.1 oxalate:formate antiporter [Massilia sp. KIM]
MRHDLPATLPAPHRAFIDRALALLPQDPRLVGLAAAGSFLTGAMDEFSDLDLIVVTEPAHQEALLRERDAIAGQLGNYLAGFSGEHVGEPRVLITLYDDPLLHVDLKFVSLDDVHVRVEEPAVLWERDGRVSAALALGAGRFPQPDIAWIEARFWIWVHYGASKIGRGELFEAIDMLGFMRSAVLGPLALQRAGARPQGVRRIETHDPAFARQLRGTLPSYDAADCVRALRACVSLYRELRLASPDARPNVRAEMAALRYLDRIADAT